MHETVLVSFAILNVNWEARGKSYIDNFVPFVADCIASTGVEVISASALKAQLKERFGIDIPVHAVGAILDRCVREGVVRRDGTTLIPVLEEANKLALSERRASVHRQYRAVVAALRSFARSNHEKDLTDEEASDLLLAYLGKRSLPVLRQVIRGEEGFPWEQDAEGDFIVGDFIATTCGSDPTTFEFLATVVKGSMLATAMYLPTPGSMGGRIEDLRALLDTPVLLRALGYQGDSHQQATSELLDVLRRLGARLSVLPATVREIRGVIDGCRAQLASPRSRSNAPMAMLDYCLKNNLSASDLDVMRERVEADLLALGVSVYSPPSIVPSLAVDEDALDAELQRRVGYRRNEARLHDLDALTAVYRIRGGVVQEHLERAKAIFVTTNSSLVRASRNFFDERPSGTVVNTAVLDHELGAVLWLKTPVGAPELPAQMVLADAYAALNPGDELWSRYLDEVDRLDASSHLSNDDYVLLRYSVEARRALMDATRGGSEIAAMTIGTVQEILASAREAAAAADRLEAQRLKQLLQSSEQERAKADQRASRLTESIAKSKSSAAAQVAAGKRQQEEKIRIRAARIAGLVSRVVFGVLFLACLAVLLVPLSSEWVFTRPLPIKWLLILLALAGALIGLVSAVGGSSAKSITGRVREKVEESLVRRFMSWFGPDSEADSAEVSAGDH